MSNKNSLYEKNKEKLKEYAWNNYYSKFRMAKSKKYYEYNKGRLQEQSPNHYRSLSKEEKDTEREYGGNRHMSEEDI